MAEREKILNFIRNRIENIDYKDLIVDLAGKLISINNCPDQPLQEIKANEKKCFSVIKEAINSFDSNITVEERPINPKIEKHPFYTNPYYTADERHTKGLPAEIVYKDRFNLFAIKKSKNVSSAARPLILNAHIDTVAPFVPFKIEDETIYGRGACDDKGLVVMLLASIKLLKELEELFGQIIRQDIVYQFVIEEETGGNGTLSACMDDGRFKGYEVIVCEATELRPHPANRGAVWFKIKIDKKKLPSAEKALPFIIKELSKLDQKLREETNLELFPKEFIQLNIGTLNSFGKHPSAVNDYVEFRIKGIDKRSLIERIDEGLKEYTKHYTDRLLTGELLQHYSLEEDGASIILKVFGISGHMSTLLERDNAIFKAGYMLSNLIDKDGINSSHIEISIGSGKNENNTKNPDKIVITGGIGFSPAHNIPSLKARLDSTIKRVLESLQIDPKLAEEAVEITADMLHNEAYQSPLDCPAMEAFKWAFNIKGIKWDKPIAFRASCDARIYAHAGYNTVTFGPGRLIYAHAPDERITVKELISGLEILILTVLRLTNPEL